MRLVSRFKDWVKTECKVEYDHLAIDVRGLAAHVEVEIMGVETRYDAIITDIRDNIRMMRDSYDVKIMRLEQKVTDLMTAAKPIGYPHPSTVVQGVNSPIEVGQQAGSSSLSQGMNSQIGVGQQAGSSSLVQGSDINSGAVGA